MDWLIGARFTVFFWEDLSPKRTCDASVGVAQVDIVGMTLALAVDTHHVGVSAMLTIHVTPTATRVGKVWYIENISHYSTTSITQPPLPHIPHPRKYQSPHTAVYVCMCCGLSMFYRVCTLSGTIFLSLYRR